MVPGRPAARLLTLAISIASMVVTAALPAHAHGIGGRLDLPVPLQYFVVGAGLVLVLSFIALAILWPEPRLQDGPDYEGRGAPSAGRGLLAVAGLGGLVLVAGQVVPPILGLDRDPTRPTIAPVLVWVVFWLIVPFSSAVVGNWYADLSPWRRLGGWLGLDRGNRDVERSLGVWPASALLLAFTWLELVSPLSGDPVVLGVAALVYTGVLIAAMAYGGTGAGLVAFDAFTTYNRLFSAISPVGQNARGRLVWRGWLRSLPVVPEWSGLWVFVVVMIGTVSYDGASGTLWFRSVTSGLLDSAGGQTMALVGMVAIVGLGYWLASAIAARLSHGAMSTARIVQRFAHTLVPIALAYAVAHYFTLILFEGQQLIAAISDPFALGWNLFGTADRKVNFFITASDPIWYIQVASIVIGHVFGVVLAHDRALADFGADAVRSQYAMLGLMIGLTTLGLVILAG